MSMVIMLVLGNADDDGFKDGALGAEPGDHHRDGYQPSNRMP